MTETEFLTVARYRLTNEQREPVLEDVLAFIRERGLSDAVTAALAADREAEAARVLAQGHLVAAGEIEAHGLGQLPGIEDPDVQEFFARAPELCAFVAEGMVQLRRYFPEIEGFSAYLDRDYCGGPNHTLVVNYTLLPRSTVADFMEVRDRFEEEWLLLPTVGPRSPQWRPNTNNVLFMPCLNDPPRDA